MCFWSPRSPGSVVGEEGLWRMGYSLCGWDPCRMLCLAWLPIDWALHERVDLSPGWHFDLVTLPSLAGRETLSNMGRMTGVWGEGLAGSGLWKENVDSQWLRGDQPLIPAPYSDFPPATRSTQARNPRGQEDMLTWRPLSSSGLHPGYWDL